MKAPFPWFGGKSRIAPRIWQLVNPSITNYVEPFGGSLAVLLGRPGWSPDAGWVETVNDADGYIANFWRAVRHAPDLVAAYANNPVNENDLHARHLWLIQQREHLTQRLEGDPEYYDAKIAGFWVWGVSTWIGHGFCSGAGPWQLGFDAEGFPVLVHVDESEADEGKGIHRKRPHMMSSKGTAKRSLPDLGNKARGVRKSETGLARQRPHLKDGGKGVARQLPFLAGDTRGAITHSEPGERTEGVHSSNEALLVWMRALSDRLRRVRVACGDWKRVIGPAVTVSIGETFLFLDPPYSMDAGDRSKVYSMDDGQVAHEVREWCVKNGETLGLSIILCGYRGEHDEDLIGAGWESIPWKTGGGYGAQGNGRGRANASREVLWINPTLRIKRAQQELFA